MASGSRRAASARRGRRSASRLQKLCSRRRQSALISKRKRSAPTDVGGYTPSSFQEIRGPKPLPESRLGEGQRWWLLEDVVLAGHGGREGAEIAPLHFRAIAVEHLWAISEGGVEHVIPLDGRAAVGSFTAHHGGERAVGDLFGFIQRRIGENRVDQVAMLVDVAVVLLDFAEPPHLAVVRLDEITAVVKFGSAFGSLGGLADRSPGAVNLAAIAEHPNAVRVLVLNGEIVPNLAGLVAQLLAR